ncbi:MAG: hypothetical protein KQH83_00885 [Actinobacteria bacterium]|jgi:hypothetical protein|nr:hypothetical protein [Actinomycetota bacterium]
MADESAEPERIDVTFGDTEVRVGLADELVEWVVHVDNRHGDAQAVAILYVRAYDPDGEFLGEHRIEPGDVARVRLRGAAVTLAGSEGAFVRYTCGPWSPEDGV